MGQMNQYEADFEAVMLEDTGSYYNRKASNWILEDSCPDYMLKAEECLKRESDRVSHYLHSSSEQKLVELCCQIELTKGKEGMETQHKGEEDQKAANPRDIGWSGMLEDQYLKIKENAETYPYVWASYIVVYGGFALWTTYRWRKLRKTENRVRILQERLHKLHAAEESSSSAASVEKAGPPGVNLLNDGSMCSFSSVSCSLERIARGL